MSLDIVCNFRKCRRSLTSQAWVTTCSHAFCVEHGKREFKRNTENSLTCPACGSELRDKFDVIQADLKPSETFKSIVLAGLKPDTIMDVAMRAMSFWSYQIEQETLYHESVAKHSKEKLECLEEVNNINTQKLKAELETCKRKITALQTEFNKKKKHAEELAAMLEDKTRKLHKLTYQLDLHKRKDIRAKDFEDDGSKRERCLDISEIVANKVPRPSEQFVFKPMKDREESNRILCSPKTPAFDFRNKSSHNASFQFRPVQF
ncbi:E3 ubiquitin-protein ligase CCNB1IP1-like [Leptidea sinapis]|uniref:E3 ubiquitin-protein ligase CCNB1IP1-like n=1 Tax=Leptidea sinapis TaxID=189913 RepID=UPI0021C2CCAA|nr:E3 ubiquitin-protein ligase CCNB1IP1-like [Leptidea sinapis]